MSLCREYTLVKHFRGFVHAKPLTCRSWMCEWCAPERKKRLMASAAAGAPQRFLTLTVNPTIGKDPDDRLQLLSAAWRTAVKRLRRIYGQHTIQYLAIVEATERGEPHLHIMLRSPYIPQALISSIMGELIDSPIVDIRKIKNTRELIRYVAKYVTKAPHHFGTGKRYWSTQSWEIPQDPDEERDAFRAVKWRIDHRYIANVVQFLTMYEGYVCIQDGPDRWLFGSSPPA